MAANQSPRTLSWKYYWSPNRSKVGGVLRSPPPPQKSADGWKNYGILGKNLNFLNSYPKNTIILPDLQMQIYDRPRTFWPGTCEPPPNLEPQRHLQVDPFTLRDCTTLKIEANDIMDFSLQVNVAFIELSFCWIALYIGSVHNYPAFF